MIKEVLGKKVKDEIAACAIAVSVCVACLVTWGVYNFIQYRQSVSVASSITSNSQEENEGTMENLTSVANVNSIEELQKINEKELEEAKKKEEQEKKKTTTKSTPEYYIKVNYKAQVVTIYTKDSKGKYTKPVKAMVCSTGRHTPTSGVYRIPNKFRWLDMLGDVYAQYCSQIVGDILFHSVPYLTKYDNSSLEYWAYDQLGTRASLGCIRLTCKDAKWIYDNCPIGTQVEFYSSSTPGPLGKPTARKISSAPKNIRGWDPTDPNKKNPWPKYLKSQQNKNKDDKKDKDKNTNNTNNNTTTKPAEPAKPEEPKDDQVNEIIINDIQQPEEPKDDLINGQVNQVETEM